MIWDGLRGHAAQVEMFRRSLSRGRLAHAYLFAGPDGIGKRTFARLLAQCLTCDRRADADVDACGECGNCRQLLAGSHPDFFAVGCPEGKRELPISVFLGPPERRGKEGLCHDLSLRPMSARRRIALIDDADLMNAESANALLKTLEEPPPDSLLILVGSNVDAILSTIRSRCQLVRFAPLPDADLAAILVERGLVAGAAEAAAVAGSAEGSVTVAEQLLDPRLRSLRDGLSERLSRADFDPFAAAKQSLEELEQLGGDAAAQRKHAGWLVRFAGDFFRRVALTLSGGDDSAAIPQVGAFVRTLRGDRESNVELALDLFDQTVVAAERLDQLAPIPLCLEGLFDALARRLREHRTLVRP